MTYAEFKKSSVYNMADVVEIFNEDGVEIDDSIPEETGWDVEKLDADLNTIRKTEKYCSFDDGSCRNTQMGTNFA